jgi:hypothetical protein
MRLFIQSTALAIGLLTTYVSGVPVAADAPQMYLSTFTGDNCDGFASRKADWDGNGASPCVNNIHDSHSLRLDGWDCFGEIFIFTEPNCGGTYTLIQQGQVGQCLNVNTGGPWGSTLALCHGKYVG